MAMKGARSRPTSTHRRRSRRVAAISARPNGSKATDEDQTDPFEAMLDDDDDDEGDDELSDDEEEQNTIEVKRDQTSLNGASSTSEEPLPAATTATDGRPEVFHAEEIDDEDDIGALVYFLDDAEHNNFFAAMINAVESYSTRMRIPIPSSVPSQAPQEPSASSSPRPKLLEEIKSDDSDESDDEKEDGPSADTLDHTEPPSDELKLNAKEATQLFHLPLGPWAEFADTPIENATVIAKLYEGANCEASIKQGQLGGRTITYISRTWNLLQKWEGFFSEMALYSDPDYLRPLQGEVIPRIIGVYLSDVKVSIAMELPSADFWIEASEAMSEELKSKCITAFDKIHERGVLHNDVELRHMLISSKGEVTIIDFQESRALKPLEEVGLRQATEADIRMEKRKIRFKLGYKDSRLQESVKMKKVVLAEEQKERRGLSASNLDSGDAHETQDPVDVLDPPIDAGTFDRYWVGELTTCRCYIVPGQTKAQVSGVIEDFLMEELARLERVDAPEMNEKDDAEAECSSSVSVAATVSSVATQLSISPVSSPILPTRINLKRKCDDSDEDSAGSHSEKKQRVECDGGRPTSPALPPVVLTAAPSTSTCAKKTPDPSSFLGAGKTLVPEIHVPFEGYTEPDGRVLLNTYNDQDVTAFRRTWIRRNSIKRSVEQNLPYPVAELYNLTPKTLPMVVRYDRHGNVKKRGRPLVSLGALKRTGMSSEELKKLEDDAKERRKKYLRDRHEPGTGLSDDEDDGAEEPNTGANDDGIREGPRILSWHELDGLPLDPVYCPDPSPHSPSSTFLTSTSKLKMPSKSALRRRLTPEEKARNVEYFEAKKRKEDDSDDDGDVSSDETRFPKRIRVDELSPSSQNSPSSDQKFGGSASSQRRFSSCGVPMPYLSRHSIARSTPPPANRSRSFSPVPHKDDSVTSSSAGFLPFSQPASPVSFLSGASGSSDGDKPPPSSAPPSFRPYSSRASETSPDSETDRESRESSVTDKSKGKSGLGRNESWGSRLGLSWSFFKK